MNDCHTIRTKTSGSGPGVLMMKEQYDAIRAFLLEILEEEKVISALELLNRCHEKFYPLYKESTGWLIYMVKIDLEVQGVIIHRSPGKRRELPTVSKNKRKGRHYRN